MPWVGPGGAELGAGSQDCESGVQCLAGLNRVTDRQDPRHGVTRRPAYCRAATQGGADGTRKAFNLANSALTERNLAIADVVKAVAAEQGRTPGQVGPAWPLQNPGVTAPIIGARTPAQLEENLGALEVDFTAAQLARLEEVSAIGLGFPHDFLSSARGRTLNSGDLKIEPRR
ncbi:aldo/keto reductase [Streptomyces sp. NPDC091272]|uniref:aldo/keto reductase n=1 Tax=Streptomyces sp. NPDC091272 TaxID=3365981 RepID=UPI003829D553